MMFHCQFVSDSTANLKDELSLRPLSYIFVRWGLNDGVKVLLNFDE